MQSIGEALATAQATGYGRRTGSKVWANSKVEVGQEGRLWRPFDKRDTGKIIAAVSVSGGSATLTTSSAKPWKRKSYVIAALMRSTIRPHDR